MTLIPDRTQKRTETMTASSTAQKPQQPQQSRAAPSTNRPDSILVTVLKAREMSVLLPLVALIIIFYFVNANFLSSQNVSTVLRASAFVGIIAVGQTVLMLAGEFDLSVGSVAAFAGTASAYAVHDWHWSIFPAVIAGLLLGAVAGLINGLLTVKVGIAALIVTLGMLYAARGLTLVVSKGEAIYPLPTSVGDFGQKRVLGTSWPFIIFIVLAIVTDLVIRQSVAGSKVLATGGNAQAATRAGINSDRVKILCFVFVGTLSALAGLLLVSSIGTADPTMGTGYELQVIAAVFVGGVSLFGGTGTVLGTVLGLMVIEAINSGLVFLGVDINWTNVAVGVLLVTAVSVDVIRDRREQGVRSRLRATLLRLGGRAGARG
jgi:ribose transport system permease protein